MKKIYRTAILGGGSRGSLFADLMQKHGGFEISAVCDLSAAQLEKCRGLLSLQEEQLFSDEEEFFNERRGELLVIATYDKAHVRQCIRALQLGYDVLLEKPISDSEEELARLMAAERESGRRVTVCHELRYGPGFARLGELVRAGRIGRLLAIDAIERVAYWHQAQAYVRLQGAHMYETYPTILAKCCHDLDLLVHYADSPCESVSSIGGLTFFRPENAPAGAGERCLSCKEAERCPYSARRVYIDAWHAKGEPPFEWPFNKVSLQYPTTEKALYEGLADGCLGKCAFLCGVEADPTVVDHQLVQMQFENGVTASLKMLFAAEAGRRINLFGTHGELLLDEREGYLELRVYGEAAERIPLGDLSEAGNSHGGGDRLLVAALYDSLSGGADTRTSLARSVESHLIGIAAERSRAAEGARVLVHGEPKK